MDRQLSKEYIPGVCNIGPAEIAKRKRGARTAVFTTIILAFTLIAIGAPRGWRLLIFIPVFGAAIGYLQSSLHFCVGFGLKGLYNVVHQAGQTDNVSNHEYREKDRKKATKIILLAASFGIIFAFLFFII